MFCIEQTETGSRLHKYTLGHDRYIFFRFEFFAEKSAIFNPFAALQPRSKLLLLLLFFFIFKFSAKIRQFGPYYLTINLAKLIYQNGHFRHFSKSSQPCIENSKFQYIGSRIHKYTLRIRGGFICFLHFEILRKNWLFLTRVPYYSL